jgi:hypothetical protein
MELLDFVIGETFWTHGGAFSCTDIGTRVIVEMHKERVRVTVARLLSEVTPPGVP